MSDILELYGDRIAPDPNSGCWLWFGSRASNGYGNLTRGGRWQYAHRLSYELHNGDGSASGLVVRHTCDVPCCVNPHHLLSGTHRDNTQDMIDRKRDRHVFGADVNTAQLTDHVVIEARQLAASGACIAALARMYSITPSAITAAVSGATWGHLPGAVNLSVVETESEIPAHRRRNRKLSLSDAREIRRRAMTRESGRKIAADFGVSPATISAIKTGRNWRFL